MPWRGVVALRVSVGVVVECGVMACGSVGWCNIYSGDVFCFFTFRPWRWSALLMGLQPVLAQDFFFFFLVAPSCSAQPGAQS